MFSLMNVLLMANFSPKHHATNKLAIAVWIAKALFLTVGIISTSVLIAKFAKSAFPYFLNLLHYSLPKLWISIVPFLAPPYLFVAINFIIMAIWKLNTNQFYDDDDVSSFHQGNATKPPHVPVSRVGIPQESDALISKSQGTATSESEENADQRLWPVRLPEAESAEEEEEYPDSIDATWRAIMDSKSSTIENLLRKSDSWGKAVHEQALASLARAAAADGRPFKKSEKFREAATTTKDIVVDGRQLKKSETFRESATATKDVAAMRKSKTFTDAWVERDEMFRYKVEAFIKMNYDQMRLQRKESEQQQQQQQRLEMVKVSY